MPLTAANLAHQHKLKAALQADKSAHKLETLAAGLLGRLLGLPIAVAKSGFQHGGDAGAAGQQGRRIRLECKKYSDETSLSDRELLGQIDHALARDEALEAWILVTTRRVPEQLAQDLVQKGERLGVPVIVIDWNDAYLAPLAALCTVDPDLVEAEFSRVASAPAHALKPFADEAVAALRRNLQSWCLGFESLRTLSHDKLGNIWTSPRNSNAELGQDAAGGAQPKRVRRRSVHDALTVWWEGSARTDSPAAIIGWDGVGKTWAALDWLMDHRADQPIVLISPSSALARVAVSESGLKRFCSDRLYELAGVRDPEHWLRRLDNMLQRPNGEGPVLTLFLDGLNQEPSLLWLPLLKVLQGDTFAGRVRIMISTRKHHFEERLSSLRGLVVPAVPVTVDVYDSAPGSELDQMLAFDGLKQADLHPDLLELARRPRLFRLVVRFRARLVDAGHVTVHRLLWEYGRDTLGERAGRSFSEAEWRAWLAEIAKRYCSGVREFSLKALVETASRADLTEREVYARLSDIIDGRFARPGPSGTMKLDPNVVSHALAAALLARLDTMSTAAFAAVEVEVMQWLDPIAGLDQRAEILRAAVSILVERGGPTDTVAAGVLVTAWLQTQNVTDGHRQELASLALKIPEALLDAVERSDSRAQASARLWAVNALRKIDRAEGPVLEVIVARVRSWLSIVSRDVDNRPDASPDLEKQRADRYRARVGLDASGPMVVLGIELQFVDRDDGRLQTAVPSILEGFPLAKVLPCFEAVAIASAVRGHAGGWAGLKWLCYFNETDPQPMAEALVMLSAQVRARAPEAGIHPGLPARAAALLLCLSGREADEDAAASIRTSIDSGRTYENDYLADPSRSFFALERRHAEFVLSDKGMALQFRLQRTRELWLDPTFQAPSSFVEELGAGAARFEVEKLNRHMGHTPETYLFEELAPALARCAPDLLTALMRRNLRSFHSCPRESRYWSAIRAANHILLAGNAEAAAAQLLRLSAREPDRSNEAVAASELLKIELQNIHDLRDQFDRLIEADLTFIPADFAELMHVPTVEDVDVLIARYGAGSTKQQYDLVVLLSVHPIPFSDDAWLWLGDLARQADRELRRVVFRMLVIADAARFGRMLLTDGWSWDLQADLWINHYGTAALIAADPAFPFDQLAPRLAPWRLLEAIRVRGTDPAETRLAAEIFGDVLRAETLQEPDPGATLTVDRSEKHFPPFVISIQPRPSPEERRDPTASLRAALDANAHLRAVETATSRVEEARKSGASLYLADIETADIEPLLKHTFDMVVHWLEGYRERSSDFRRRVRLAETAFLALCETLLIRDPERGADLWRALRETMVTRYIGAAGVDELLRIVFCVPDSPSVAELRDEVISLPLCHTDQRLFEICVAASYHGKSEWLAAVAAEDQESPLVWKQRRGALLAGFSTGNTLPVADAWPEGEIRTSHADLRRKAARFRWSEACAHHWWRAYLGAQDESQAYAAWILFLRSADRRAWTWMREDVEPSCTSDNLMRRKLIQIRLNRSELKGGMTKRLDNCRDKFLDHDIVNGVGPWGQVPDAT